MPRRLPRTTAEQWALLAAVIDQGGFAQASDALHRSQSTISYALRRLQDQLGLPLLETRGRRTVLNTDGLLLLARARRIVADLIALEQLAGSLDAGWEAELRLTIDASFPGARLLPVLEELHRRCAHTRLHLDQSVLSGAEDALLEGRTELAITPIVPPTMLGEWLMDVHFVAVAQRDHALHGLGRELTLDDLARHTQSVVRDSGARNPRDAGWLGAPQRWTVSSPEASLASVEAGLTFAWIPEHLAAPGLESGRLKRLPLAAGGVRSQPLHLVLAQPATAGPAARLAASLFRGAL